MMYKGKLAPEQFMPQTLKKADPSLSSATIAYGVGNWYLYTGRQDWATAIFAKLINESPQRTSFGYIAAEAELRRTGIRINALAIPDKPYRMFDSNHEPPTSRRRAGSRLAAARAARRKPAVESASS